MLLNENMLSLYRHKPLPYRNNEEGSHLLAAAEESAEYGKKQVKWGGLEQAVLVFRTNPDLHFCEFQIQHLSLHGQQVSLAGVIGPVGIFHTHKPLFQCRVKVVINEILSILKVFGFHHLFDTHFLVSNDPYMFDDIVIISTQLTNCIYCIYRSTYTGTCGVLVLYLSRTCGVSQIGLNLPFLCRMDMQIAVSQIPLFTEQQVAEEAFKIEGSIVNPFRNVTVIGSYQPAKIKLYGQG